MVTIFIICTGEDWYQISSVYIRAARETSPVFNIIAQTYFITLTVLGFIVLLSLFVALLLKNFNSSKDR